MIVRARPRKGQIILRDQSPDFEAPTQTKRDPNESQILAK